MEGDIEHDTHRSVSSATDLSFVSQENLSLTGPDEYRDYPVYDDGDVCFV